jgi:hypothetical protein
MDVGPVVFLLLRAMARQRYGSCFRWTNVIIEWRDDRDREHFPCLGGFGGGVSFCRDTNLLTRQSIAAFNIRQLVSAADQERVACLSQTLPAVG